MLRVFFLWLLEPEEGEAYFREELAAHQSRLAEFEALAAEPRSNTRKERMFGIALEAGLRSRRMAVDWAEWALTQVRRPVRTKQRS
jgi:PadR family transcriptional regulator, regulatory protein AphA